MLNILFGRAEGTIYYPPLYFDVHYKLEWFDDPLVIEMIKDIDGTDVLNKTTMVHPIFGDIPVIKLSGSVKTLILLHMVGDRFIFDVSSCGDNCSPWLLKIAENAGEFTVHCGHMLRIPFDDRTRVRLLNEDIIVSDYKTYIYAVIRYITADKNFLWDYRTKTFEEIEDDYTDL